jgi:hypothetical protein
MKNDYSFKLVVAVILAGVVVAFASPSSQPAHAVSSAAKTATTAAAELTE